MKNFLAIAALLLPLVGNAQQPPVPLTVLGIPLGAPMDRPIEDCEKSLGQPRTDYCNRFGAFSPRPGGQASLQRPARGSAGIALPDWLRSVSVSFDAEGRISRILATTAGPSAQVEIIDAIQGKFGKTTKASEREAQNAYGTKWLVKTAVWDLPDVYVVHSCSQINECYVIFETPAEHARSIKEFEEKKGRNKL